METNRYLPAPREEQSQHSSESYPGLIQQGAPLQQEENRMRRNRKGGGGALIALVMALCILSSGMTTLGVYRWLSANDNPQRDASNPVAASTVQLSQVAYTSGSETYSYASIVEKSAASVVEITTEVRQVNRFIGQYTTEGAGSGVILTSDGYIVTNYHVISGAASVTVRLNEGSTYAAELIGVDQNTDLAVVKIEAQNLTAAVLADSDTLRVGDLALAIGNPIGELGGTVTDGIISALDREISIDGQSMTLLQTSAAVNPGNSGGGFFNSNGDLVGIVNAKSSGSDIEGLAFAIPSNTVAEVAKELIEYGYVTGRPQLGISIVEISDRWTAQMYRVSQLGVYVTEASSASGLSAGDLILSIEGTAISTASDISQLLAQYEVGDSLRVSLLRNGKNMTITATLTEQIPERSATYETLGA